MLMFQHKIDCVLHLAGLKAVRESHSQPLQYYNVNVIGSVNLFEVSLCACKFPLTLKKEIQTSIVQEWFFKA